MPVTCRFKEGPCTLEKCQAGNRTTPLPPCETVLCWRVDETLNGETDDGDGEKNWYLMVNSSIFQLQRHRNYFRPPLEQFEIIDKH